MINWSILVEPHKIWLLYLPLSDFDIDMIVLIFTRIVRFVYYLFTPIFAWGLIFQNST